MPARLLPRLLILTLFAALLGATGCGQEGSRGARGGERETRTPRVFLTPVVTRTVTRGDVRALLDTTGTVIPARTLALRTDEGGQLRFAREWMEGDLVEEGEVIAEIRSPALDREHELNRLDLELQKENVDIGDRALRAAEREFRALQDLYARGVTALRDVESAQLEFERAQNSARQNRLNLEKAESRLRESEQRLERLVLRAPWAGMIVTPATLQGDGSFRPGFGTERITDAARRDVSAGHTVCGLMDISSVYLRSDVTSRDIAQVGLGQPVTLEIFASPPIRAEGSVARISDSVNPDTRAFEVDVRVENPERRLRPNMFGRAGIVTDVRPDAISVPRAAITRRNNRDVVFIVEEDPSREHPVARMVEVELGLEAPNEIEVAFGLRTGDRLIVRGFEVIQDGTPVRPVDEDAPITAEDEELPIDAPAAPAIGS